MQEKSEDDNKMDDQIKKFLQKSDLKDKCHALQSSHERFTVNIDDIRSNFPDLASYIILKPIMAVQMFEENANAIIDEIDSSISREKLVAQASVQFPVKEKKLKLNFEGNFGRNFVTPRGLKANMVNNLVRVQGIVTRMSIVKPKLMKSYHFIPATNSGFVQSYQDQYSVEGQGNFSSKLFPTKDAGGNSMSAEYGYCDYKNVQKLIIQEMPERSPTGQIPRSVTIFLEEDLVDKVKPGDRVDVTGLFKCISSHNSATSGVFRTLIVATGIQSINDKTENMRFSPKDIANIKEFSKREDKFEVLAQSVAPTVQGHKNIKKSVLLQLLGGAEKNLSSGTHLRGDINILLIGDPSTAKSQMLRHSLSLAPIAINTTGRGSSGVGLTASVIIDKETGERHLEAGAMVLGDKGLVCIDEFDKMDDCDRVAIHEVMEQQTVTIAKAGIHASLNARCSVMAAANPIYGDYDRNLPAAKNIGLSDTLLSRFDLLFVVLDEKNPHIDKKIAERVIRNHTFRNPEGAGIFNPFQDEFHIEPEITGDEENEKESEIYEKSNETLYGNLNCDIVTTMFLKKYIAYVKSMTCPKLDNEVVEFISHAYRDLRQKAVDKDFVNSKKLPVTVRTLESIIRLGTAHSKLRLDGRRKVLLEDCQEALKLMNYAIFDEDDDEEG